MINHDLIESLIISIIAGNSTPEDKAHLERLIAESEEAKEYHDKVYKVLMSNSAVNARAALSREAPRPVKYRKIKRMINPVSVGLFTAAIVLIIFYILPAYVNSINGDGRELLATTNDVRLVLGEKEVRLDRSEIVSTVAGVKLNIRHDTLNYSLVNDQQDKRMADLIVPEGKHYYFVTSDGTQISANPVTTVRFPLVFTGGSREITVDGEAFITAAQDDKRPFIVHVKDITVQVLGTAFNVNSHDGQLRISLVSGKVKVIAGNKSMILNPAEEALIQPGTEPQVLAFSPEDVLKRQLGEFSYEDKTMEQLAIYIHRYYGLEVRLDNRSDKDLRSGMITRRESIDTFLKKNQLKYEKIKDTLVIK